MSTSSYFLGANTCCGFYSCYHGFCKPESDFLFVIKGGPGCGKSSFMRKIGNAAENAGFTVEYVLCSGDPDSLDGVRIPELQLGYMDGTAPHIADPAYAGVSGAYLDLGAFYDLDALRALREPMIEKYGEYRQHYRQAYDLLAAHHSKTDPIPIRTASRFLSAVTCKGIIDISRQENCVSVTEDHLAELAADKDCNFIERHPLWPEKILGVAHDDRHYRAKLILPEIGDALSALEKAKAAHDALEALYNPHTNFDGVYETAEKHIKKYIGKPL